LETHAKQGQFDKTNFDGFLNYEGVVLFDLLPHGQAVNSQYYCELLKQVYKVLDECNPVIVNRKRVILQQDNALPYT